jgi:hypothetical protein
VRLHNLWTTATIQAEGTPVVMTIAQDQATENNTDSKAAAQRPNLSRTELSLAIAELSEWMDSTGKSDVSDIYSNWKGGKKKHGFTRPEIRFLLTAIAQLE